MDTSSLLALSTLLKPPEDKESDETLDGTVNPSPYATPGAIGTGSGSQKTSETLGKGGDIWRTEEVSEKQHYEYEDPRPQPDYDLIFKQSVGAEDVFLGMGGKTPATASCEGMVVKIKLPGAELKDVQLDITDTFLDCKTTEWRLGLHLPHKVNSQHSKAKWISDLQELHVTLLLNREYDFINQ